MVLKAGKSRRGKAINALHKSCIECTVRMGIAESICAEGEQLASILYRLQKAEGNDCQGCLYDPVNGRVLDFLGKLSIFPTLHCNFGY